MPPKKSTNKFQLLLSGKASGGNQSSVPRESSTEDATNTTVFVAQINSPLQSGVQVFVENQTPVTGQGPAENAETQPNPPLPSGGNVDDLWLLDGELPSIQVPKLPEPLRFGENKSASDPISLVTTSCNFSAHPVGSIGSYSIVCEHSAVLAVMSILENAGIMKHVASSDQVPVKKVLPTFKLNNESLSSLKQFSSVIRSVLSFVDMPLSIEQQTVLFKIMGVNPKEMIPLAQIIQFFETPLVLSKETENLIKFPPIGGRERGGGSPDDGFVDDHVFNLVHAMVGLVAGENSAMLSIRLEDMIKHVFTILESHADVCQRFQLFLTVFPQLPSYFFGNEKKNLDFNRIIQTILFDANKGLLESTKDPKEVYECCVSLLRHLNSLVTDLSNLTIPVLGLNGERVSTKKRKEVDQMKMKQNVLELEIKSHLFIVSMIVRWFKFTQEYVNRSAVLRFQTPEMKQFFELSLFEFKTFLEMKSHSSTIFIDLSFESEDLRKLALVAVKNNTSCVRHKSCIFGAGSGQLDLNTFCRVVFDEKENKDKVVVVGGGVGKGKTTIAVCAACIELVSTCKHNTGEGFLVYCGPPHLSNCYHIATLCLGLEEYHKSMGQTGVRIMPIFDGIVPTSQVGKKTDGKQQVVYVIVVSCMNQLYAVFDRVSMSTTHVIIDDNDTVTRSEVMTLIRNLDEVAEVAKAANAAKAAKTAKTVKTATPPVEVTYSNRVFMLGSTMKNPMSFDKNVLRIGGTNESTDTDIRAIRGQGYISSVPLTVDQMMRGIKLVSNATTIVQTESFNGLLSKLILLMSQLKRKRRLMHRQRQKLKQQLKHMQRLKPKQRLKLKQQLKQRLKHDASSNKRVKSVLLSCGHSYVSSLIQSGVYVRFTKDSFESELDFFKAFHMFIEAVFVFLKRPEIFPVNTAVMYETIMDDLENSSMNFLDKFLEFLLDYKNQMNEMFTTSVFFSNFPEIPSSTLTQSEIESLSTKMKGRFREIFDKKLTFSFKELCLPPHVPVGERKYSHYHNPTIYVLGKNDDPYNVANDIAAMNREKFSKVHTDPVDTTDVEDSTHQSRQRTGGAVRTTENKEEALPTNAGSHQAGSLLGAESSKPKKSLLPRTTRNEKLVKKSGKDGKRSSGGPEDDGSEDEVPADVPADVDIVTPESGGSKDQPQNFVESPDDKVTFQFIMKRAKAYMETRSGTAPLPDSQSVSQLVKFLYETRNPCWNEVLYNFVYGVVVMDYSNPSEMTILFLDLLCQGRLAHVIQEDHFDMTSMNLQYKGNLVLVFLSEVSPDYCRQLMGRCGRVSTTKEQGIGIVRCETPSGELVLPETDDAIHSQNHDVVQPNFVGTREEFQSAFNKLSSDLVDKLYRFLSSCKLAKDEFSFFNHLLVLFQELLYNKAFMYCCKDNNVKQIMTFLSCALIVLCGNHLQYYHVFVDIRLRCLALNQNALENLVVTPETLENIRLSFVRQIGNMLTEADLQSIFGMFRVMEEKTIRFCSLNDLSRMYLNLKTIVGLSHLLEKFLFNIQSSKNSQEVNALLTMLHSLHDVLDQIMIIIMSFSIPCSKIESVKHSSHEKPVVAVASCSVAEEDSFVSLMRDLTCGGPLTFKHLWSCLLHYEHSLCVRCTFGIRDFQRLFGNPEQTQPPHDFLDGQIATVLRGLTAQFLRIAQEIASHAEKVKEADKNIAANMDKPVIVRTKLNLPFLKSKTESTAFIESLKQKNSEISSQIESLKTELSPYRGLSEEDAVALFIQQLKQYQ